MLRARSDCGVELLGLVVPHVRLPIVVEDYKVASRFLHGLSMWHAKLKEGRFFGHFSTVNYLLELLASFGCVHRLQQVLPTT